MTALERFSQLTDQVEQAERNIRSAVAEDHATLQARLDGARRDADERSNQLRARIAESAESAESAEGAARTDDRWQELHRSWEQHVERVRQRVAEHKAGREANRAERDAQRAEADALDALVFAAAVIEESKYAVLCAALARLTADAAVGTQ